MVKASILCRISDKKKSEKEQEPECRQLVEDEGWDLFKVYYEKGSAYKNNFEDREVWQQILKDAKKNNVKYIVVWNMDRYSRLPEDIVLKYTQKLALLNNIQIRAVHGDSWSELIETVSKLKDLGFVGEALSEFLEKLLKGFEHRRAYRESKVKSQRVKLKVVKKEGKITKSTYGNKWGKSGIPKALEFKVIQIWNQDKSLSCRKIEEMNLEYETKTGKKRFLKKTKIAEILKNHKENNCPKILS